MMRIKKIAIVFFVSVFVFPAMLFAADKPILYSAPWCGPCNALKSELNSKVPDWRKYIDVVNTDELPADLSMPSSIPHLVDAKGNTVNNHFSYIQKYVAQQAKQSKPSVANPPANISFESPSPSIPKGAIFIRHFVPVISKITGKITGYDLYDWSDPPKKISKGPTGIEGTAIIKGRTEGSWLYIYPFEGGREKGNYKIGEYISSDLSDELPALPHPLITATKIEIGDISPTYNGYELVLYIELSNGKTQEALVEVSDKEIAKEIAAAKKRGETITEEDAAATLLNKRVKEGIDQLVKDANAPKKPSKTDTPSPFSPKTETKTKPATVKPNGMGEVHNPFAPIDKDRKLTDAEKKAFQQQEAELLREKKALEEALKNKK